MVTVKELVPLLKEAKRIVLNWDGFLREYDPDNVLDVDAYGNYVIDKIINSIRLEEYELRIAVYPVKEEYNGRH